MKKSHSLIITFLLAVMMLFAVSCNGKDDVLTDASESGAATETQTEESTKKPSSEKQTEPPSVVSDTTGLDLNIKVLSQNLCATDRPNGNSVEERTTRFGALIEEYAPDIIGTQEATLEWIRYFSSLDNYETVGVSRNGNRSLSGEWNAILYNKDRFVLMDEGTFWLSSTPNVASTTANACSPRICTWAELFDTYTGRTVIMANTHLDNANENVRNDQANNLIRHLKGVLKTRFTQCQIYLTCDLNATENEMAHDTIYSRAFIDVRDLALEDLSKGKGTYHAFGHIENGKEIDFCFHRGNDTVLSYEIIDKNYASEGETEEGFVSDHYGVLVTFGITK